MRWCRVLPGWRHGRAGRVGTRGRFAGHEAGLRLPCAARRRGRLRNSPSPRRPCGPCASELRTVLADFPRGDCAARRLRGSPLGAHARRPAAPTHPARPCRHPGIRNRRGVCRRPRRRNGSRQLGAMPRWRCACARHGFVGTHAFVLFSLQPPTASELGRRPWGRCAARRACGAMRRAARAAQRALKPPSSAAAAGGVGEHCPSSEAQGPQGRRGEGELRSRPRRRAAQGSRRPASRPAGAQSASAVAAWARRATPARASAEFARSRRASLTVCCGSESASLPA